MKEVKGFTLVELLAVIIVLAIIMLIAVNSVLPIMNQARQGTFASSANIILEAVETAVIADEINQKKFDCYSVSYLVTNNYIKKIKANATDGFTGYVTVTRTLVSGNTTNYSYGIFLEDHKNSFKLSKATVENPITADDIATGVVTISASCPTGTTPAT